MEVLGRRPIRKEMTLHLGLKFFLYVPQMLASRKEGKLA